jgi:hypothetical protein
LPIDVLYRLDLSGNNNEPQKLATDVTMYECHGDTVFCINQQDRSYGDNNREEIIFSIDKNGNKQTITKDFDKYSVCGDEIYYLDGYAFYRSSGGAGELVGEIEIDFPETDISEIVFSKSNNGYLVVKIWKNDETSECYVFDGENFVNIEKLKEN